MNSIHHQLLILYLLGFILFTGCETNDDPTPTPTPDDDCFELTGNAISELRDLANFNKITVNGLADIQLRPGPFEPISVMADEGMMPHIETTVENGRLTITFEGCLDSNTDGFVTPTYIITLSELNSLNCSGLINVSNEGILKGDELEIESHGVENFDLDVEYNILTTTVKGAGNIDIRGLATEQELNIYGAGTYQAFGLESDECIIKIIGAGDAEVYVNHYLKVDIYGAGKVCYKGDPSSIDSDINHLGSLSNCD